jgi:hypothetical protein
MSELRLKKTGADGSFAEISHSGELWVSTRGACIAIPIFIEENVLLRLATGGPVSSDDGGTPPPVVRNSVMNAECINTSNYISAC